MQSEASAKTEEWLRPFALYIQLILLFIAFVFGYRILKDLKEDDQEFESLISSRVQDHISQNPHEKDTIERKWRQYRV